MGEGAKCWALQPSGQSERGVGRFAASAAHQLQGCQMSKNPTGYFVKTGSTKY